MINLPAECERMDADPARNSPRMFLWALVAGSVPWVLIWWGVWELTKL